MLLNALKSKIHRATITKSNLNYNGSIAIDKNILKKANIYPNEKVEIYNINNGLRFATYVIEAAANSKTIAINGSAARLVQEGDLIIICAYAMMTEEEIKKINPTMILLDNNNEIIKK